MKTTGIVINQFPSQSYKTIFNQKNGFFIRLEDKPGHEPSWSSYGPELVDISITSWCDKECSFCYKSSSPLGKHLKVEVYISIMRQLEQMKVLQVALGGGNPNQHPDFCKILELTREEYNIIPSFTTNGRGLSKEVLIAAKKYCGAVAVSAYEPYEDLLLAIQKLIDNGIRANIHFLLTSRSVDTAIKWLKNPPEILNHINAIIFLNYKPVGRDSNKDLFLKNSPNYPIFFQLAGRPHPFKIGFDSCSISGIASFMNISPMFMERCEAGRFSLYISEDNKMYPCSFMVDKIEGIPVTEDNIQTTWKYHDTFVRFREIPTSPICQGCGVQDICFGGCPIFPEINTCSSD